VSNSGGVISSMKNAQERKADAWPTMLVTTVLVDIVQTISAQSEVHESHNTYINDLKASNALLCSSALYAQSQHYDACQGSRD
jgi:hypothetical protein